jgi:heterodisulfide reductase subunit C
MCTTRCPQGIKITDLLYALKRTAMESGVYPDRYPVYLLSRNFVRLVNRYGRNQEIRLVLKYYLRRNPLELFRLFPLGWSLWRRGRVSLWPGRIRNIAALRQIQAAARELELPATRSELEYAPKVVGYGGVG